MSTEQTPEIQQAGVTDQEGHTPRTDTQHNAEDGLSPDHETAYSQAGMAPRDALEGLCEAMRIVDRIRSDAIREWEKRQRTRLETDSTL